MKVGIVSTNLFSVPPRGTAYSSDLGWLGGYGGESQVHTIVKALCNKGIEVELFATAGSIPPKKGNLHYVTHGTWFYEFVTEQLIFKHYKKELEDCDILHDWSLTKAVHNWAFDFFDKKAVKTCWGSGFPPIYRRYNNLCWSEFHKKLAINQGYPTTTKIIHGCIDTDVYEPCYEEGNYILFIGRMHPTKRNTFVAQLAKDMGFKMIIGASIESPDHLQHLASMRELIKGHDNISIIEGPTLYHVIQLLRHAKALILPSYGEVFGLIVTEAMACGTPVITSRDGAFPEIITNGVDGFICPDQEHYKTAIKNIDNIDRRKCRKKVEDKFNSKKKADEYIDVYKKVLAGDVF